MIDNICAAASRNGVTLSQRQTEAFALFAKMLTECNERFNLTSLTDPNDIATKHFVDSLAAVDIIPNGASCVDIGCGAGFPSVPIALMRPDLKFVLLDASNKKIGFLKDVVSNFLLDALPLHSRAEDYAKVGRASFDIAVARAVSSLPTLLEYALPLVKTGGAFIAYKGENPQAEIAASAKALRILGGEVETVREFLLDGIYKRSLIVVKKVATTPTAYPRGMDKPKRQPL